MGLHTFLEQLERRPMTIVALCAWGLTVAFFGIALSLHYTFYGCTCERTAKRNAELRIRRMEEGDGDNESLVSSRDDDADEDPFKDPYDADDEMSDEEVEEPSVPEAFQFDEVLEPFPDVYNISRLFKLPEDLEFLDAYHLSRLFELPEPPEECYLSPFPSDLSV